MTNVRLIVLVVLGVCGSGVAGLSGAVIRHSGSTEAKSVEVRTEVRYLMHTPAGYDADATREWPLVLFLHGAGERGDDLERVKANGPPMMAARGDDLPYLLVSPQCPVDEIWNPWALHGLLDAIEREYRVDRSRVYVTGLSMGGYGTWAVAAAAPDRFAAVAPICGGAAMPFWTVMALKDTPVWAFHGSDDRVVALSESVDAVEMVRLAGGDARLTVYEGVGHDSWSATYADEGFWEWMLGQRREVSAD